MRLEGLKLARLSPFVELKPVAAIERRALDRVFMIVHSGFRSTEPLRSIKLPTFVNPFRNAIHRDMNLSSAV